MMIANRFRALEAPRDGASIRATDMATAQTVVLHPVADLDTRLVGIFHPALLTIFDIVDHEGQQFAACEFVPARSLAGERCHPRRACEIVSEVADAVAELHARGLTHGQISTASVFLTTKGKAKLSLTTAVTPSDAREDVEALRRLLEEVSGRTFTAVAQTDSAAVLAALLRTVVIEPS